MSEAEFIFKLFSSKSDYFIPPVKLPVKAVMMNILNQITG